MMFSMHYPCLRPFHMVSFFPSMVRCTGCFSQHVLLMFFYSDFQWPHGLAYIGLTHSQGISYIQFFLSFWPFGLVLVSWLRKELLELKTVLILKCCPILLIYSERPFIYGMQTIFWFSFSNDRLVLFLRFYKIYIIIRSDLMLLISSWRVSLELHIVNALSTTFLTITCFVLLEWF